MFSQVVATGENVWIPSTGAMPPEFDQHDHISNNIGSSDEHVVEDLNTPPPTLDDICSSRPKDPNSSTSSQGSKRSCNGRSFKDKGKKQAMESHIEKLVESSKSVASSFFMPTKPPNVYLLNEALEKLVKYPEIYENSRFCDWATVFLMTMTNRATFWGIPNNKRLEWLKNRYMHNSS
ncbi:hypothetical protein KSP40_PGU014805 [Platanthera guangdongensis]|uniref:Uncharacterized protein n=1 Tax=Platanthera guangdongensis TaxID=2320717 RepID=A0ABR2M9F6_9ASPA